MSRQIPLPLALHNSSQLADYVVGDNQDFLDLLQQQRDSHAHALLYLTGAPGAGRTHLLLGQCHAAQAQGLHVAYLPGYQMANLSPAVLHDLHYLDIVAIDDLHCLIGNQAWETALFSLFNLAREQGCQLLCSATDAALALSFQLPDLRSRLSWGITYRLKPLADAQAEYLLCQLAARVGLILPTKVCRYIIQHQSRDPRQLVTIIEQLNQASLIAKRPLTLPFVREQLL